jgi:hypothetical protein
MLITALGILDLSTQAWIFGAACVISRFEEHLRQIRTCMNTMTLLQVNEQLRKDNIKAMWDKADAKGEANE